MSVLLARRVNHACERYEASWKDGTGVSIEEVLDSMTEPEWSAAFAELLALDLELRIGRGERPRREDYAGRFPGQDNLIAAAFQALESERATRGRASERLTAARATATQPGDIPPSLDCSTGEGAARSLGDYELMEEIAPAGAWESSTRPAREASTVSSP